MPKLSIIVTRQTRQPFFYASEDNIAGVIKSGLQQFLEYLSEHREPYNPAHQALYSTNELLCHLNRDVLTVYQQIAQFDCDQCMVVKLRFNHRQADLDLTVVSNKIVYDNVNRIRNDLLLKLGYVELKLV